MWFEQVIHYPNKRMLLKRIFFKSYIFYEESWFKDLGKTFLRNCTMYKIFLSNLDKFSIIQGVIQHSKVDYKQALWFAQVFKL